MTRRSFYLLLSVFMLSTQVFAQVSKLSKEAQVNLEKGHLKTAVDLYKSILTIEPENRNANLNLGLIYSELLDNFVLAQPYLEKTMQLPAKDTAYDVIFALGKCYQFNGEFDRAMSFYNRLGGVQDLEEERNFQRDIEKLKLDCEYAQLHTTDTVNRNIYFANAGKAVNTDMPEYVPVLTSKDELIFTSKRQDDPKEELNYIDGKYYESMYIAKIESNGFSGLRRYTLPDKLINSKMYNHHFAVVSLSQDQKKLFTFKDNKLYEISLEERAFNEPAKLKIKKFDHYQNHAYLTKDEKTLYFTSDFEGGLGGTDIYQTTKDEKGEWTMPVNLGAPINTPFNEDAPFLDSDSTFYFASEGHPGFGNYDIFKSRFEDGKWLTPTNLGKPVNTTAHDIFLVMDSTHSIGYFSSGRKGGFGDMDIYKIVYLDKFPRNCMPYDEKAIFVSASDNNYNDFKNTVQLNVAANYQVLELAWKLNGTAITSTALSQEYDYGNYGKFPVELKVMVGCDTCLNPVVACIYFENKLEKTETTLPLVPLPTTSVEPLASINAREKQNALANASLTATKNETISTGSSNQNQPLATNTAVSLAQMQDNGKTQVPISTATQVIAASSVAAQSTAKDNTTKTSKIKFTPLSNDELNSLGIGNEKILFDLSKASLLNTDIDILRNQLQALVPHPDLYIRIVGYADARGSVGFNKTLSLNRATAVRKFLTANGLPAARIMEVVGAGATNFVNECGIGVDCADEKHKENRRVELEIVRKTKL